MDRRSSSVQFFGTCLLCKVKTFDLQSSTHQPYDMSQLQKHTTIYAIIGWIMIIAASYPLLQGLSSYSNDFSGETYKRRLAVARLNDAMGSFGTTNSDYEEGQGLVPCLIGGAMIIVGLVLALGSSVFRCSECGGKVAMKTAKICPSCRTSFDTEKSSPA